MRLSRGRELEGHARERSALETGEDPRDEAPLRVPGHREQKMGQPARLVGIERDRGLRLLSAPDTEARVLGLGEVEGDAQSAVADVRVALEVLDDFRPLSLAAVRAEAEVVLYLSSTPATAAHRASSMPPPRSGQADRVAHRLD